MKLFSHSLFSSLTACLLATNVYADRHFTASSEEHIPSAIQQIAQASAKSASPDIQDDQADGASHPSSQTKDQPAYDAGVVSEAFGHLIVKNLENPGFKFDIKRVIKGMQDEADGKPSPLSDEEYEQAIVSIQEQIFNQLAEKNLKEANDFLQKNAHESGVVELIPGKLQYKILEQGNGPAVEPHSTPVIHYTGKYIDGTVFGSSKELGEPISLPLDQTIPGFSKGLVGMREGEKRMLFIHPDLGYGLMGQLPPNSLLIFEVDLEKANADEESKDQSSSDTPAKSQS